VFVVDTNVLVYAADEDSPHPRVMRKPWTAPGSSKTLDAERSAVV
jgi:predicted nucleic acid-binding protein